MEYNEPMAKRRKKIRPPSRFPLVLVSFGLVLLALWGVHRYFYIRSMSLSDAILARYAKETGMSAPVSISVGDTIHLPVVEAGNVDGTWAISNTAANHVHQSASPGGRGNIVIYAHNTASLFSPLDTVRIGTPITIRTSDGALHQYIVASVSWVTPGHTELLLPTTIETLTLYTCAGLLDSLRIVVRAVPAK
jgi:LPXTG-site transpeptidase (sortase) family protein